MNLSEDSITAIFSAAMGALAIVIAAALPLLISTHRRVKQSAEDSAATREQVTNDHTTNLRVESDERHAEVMEILGLTGKAIERNTRRIDALGVRIDVVEDTYPPKSKTRQRRKNHD